MINSNNEIKKTIPWQLVVVFLVFSAVIILTGISYFNSQRKKIFGEEEINLSAIESLKIDQIEDWRKERLGDAVVITHNKPLIRSLKLFFSNNSKDLKSELSEWMQSLTNEYDYRNVLIADTKFKVRLSVTPSDTILGDSIKMEIKTALSDHNILLTDLHDSKEITYVHLDIIIPLFETFNDKKIPVGVAILRIDPTRVLFPLIQSWPTQSKSSETLLLRKDGNSVLYLNDLRHSKNAALKLRLPLSNKKLLASNAVSGYEGVIEGVDYRNISVIGSIQRIPGTAWFMVAKVDKEEILEPLQKYALLIIIVVVLLILMNASIFVFWIRQQRLKELKNEISIHELDEKFTTAFRMSPVSVTISSITDNKFIDVNNTFLKDMEYKREEVIGRTAKELDIWADENERLWIINEIGAKGKVFGKVIRYKTRTGNILYGLSSMSVVKVNGEPCNLSTVVNITESKKAELRLIESEELFRELFENMLNGFAYCKMICEENQPLDFLYINVNEAFGKLTGLKGVTGKRASEAIPGIQEADPELLERYNRVSSTGIPEVFETYVDSLKMWFAISVYSPQKGYFVAVFDVITTRKIAEEKLHESRATLQSIIDNSNSLIYLVDAEGRFVMANEPLQTLISPSGEKLIGKTREAFLPKEIADLHRRNDLEVFASGKTQIFEEENIEPDGNHYYLTTKFPLFNNQNEIYAVGGLSTNITERKKIEKTLKESEDKFRKAFLTNPDSITITSLEDGTYVSVNNGFTQIFGYSEEEVIGNTPFDISIWYNTDDRKHFIHELQVHGSVGNFETKFYTKSRKLLDCLISATTVNLDGEIHVLSTTRDITERKIAELALSESEERFRSLYENVTIGIYRTTADGRILMANPALVKMLGFDSFEQLANRNLEKEGYEPDYPRAQFLETIEKEGKIIGLESAWSQRNGKTLFVRESANAVKDPDGRMLYFDGTVEDITDRKMTEEALRESEDKFKYIFDHSVIGKSITFPSGELHVNKAFCDMLGYSEKELEKTKWQDITHPEDIKLTQKELQSLVSGKKESTRFIKRYLHKNGSVIWTDVSTALRRDISDKPLYFMTAVIDITERKMAEVALLESEERFSKSFRTSPISFMIANLEDGRIIEINDAFTTISGFTREEAIGNTTLEMKIWVDEDDRKHMVDSLRKGKPILHKETMLRGREGNVAIVLLSAQVIKLANRNCIISSIEDITERKRAEEALRESEDKFKYIFEHSALGNSITHPDGKTQFNKAFCEMLGYSADELVKMKWQEFTHPDDFEITQKILDTLVSRESDSPRFVKRYLRKDGSVMWADVSTSLRYDKNNNPLYFMTTVNDITDLKLAEEVLRNDEKRFRELIEALPQLYWTCRVDGPCDYLSNQWVKYTGIPESDQLGYRWLEQLHPEDREKTISVWTEKVKTGTSFDIEFRIRRYDGKYHWFKTRAVPIHDADCNLIKWLGSNTDIDSIRRAEDQLRNYNKNLEMSVIQRTEQLEAANKELESFSYSVSHDLRAPLRAVHGYTKILLEDFSDKLDDEGRRICGIISGSATQMGELIDDLLSFSRIGRSDLSSSAIDMKKMAGVIFEGITSPTERERIKFKVGKLQKAHGDVKLMGQVWTNLLSNAIKYSSKNEVSEIMIGSSVSDKMVTYFVKDNGVGFDMQYAHKLFGVFQRLHSEAEFEGNGVGLAIVQRIILKHGGKVWAEGEVEKGATFFFSLPVNGEGIVER